MIDCDVHTQDPAFVYQSKKIDNILHSNLSHLHIYYTAMYPSIYISYPAMYPFTNLPPIQFHVQLQIYPPTLMYIHLYNMILFQVSFYLFLLLRFEK